MCFIYIAPPRLLRFEFVRFRHPIPFYHIYHRAHHIAVIRRVLCSDQKYYFDGLFVPANMRRKVRPDQIQLWLLSSRNRARIWVDID